MAAVYKMQTNIFSLFAVVLVVFCTGATETAGMRPLVRAPRATRVESDYFVHMKDSVSFMEMKNYTEELEAETDDSNFTVRINGLAYNAAHGWTGHLSDAALQKVVLSCGADES